MNTIDKDSLVIRQLGKIEELVEQFKNLDRKYRFKKLKNSDFAEINGLVGKVINEEKPVGLSISNRFFLILQCLHEYMLAIDNYRIKFHLDLPIDEQEKIYNIRCMLDQFVNNDEPKLEEEKQKK